MILIYVGALEQYKPRSLFGLCKTCQTGEDQGRSIHAAVVHRIALQHNFSKLVNIIFPTLLSSNSTGLTLLDIAVSL